VSWCRAVHAGPTTVRLRSMTPGGTGADNSLCDPHRCHAGGKDGCHPSTTMTRPIS
jgi:hypothetical protein